MDKHHVAYAESRRNKKSNAAPAENEAQA